jgi:hypothetical protein
MFLIPFAMHSKAFLSAWKRMCKYCLTKLQNYKRVIKTIYVFDIMFCFENIIWWSNNACVNTPYSFRNIWWVGNKFVLFVIISCYEKYDYNGKNYAAKKVLYPKSLFGIFYYQLMNICVFRIFLCVIWLFINLNLCYLSKLMAPQFSTFFCSNFVSTDVRLSHERKFRNRIGIHINFLGTS